MAALRSLLLSRPWLALCVIVVALAAKAMVPQGYMPAIGKTLTVTLCSAAGDRQMQMPIPMHDSGKSDMGGKAGDGGCAFSALSHAAAPALDLVLLALAIGFILALGTASTALPAPAQRRHLKPPLRGPPAYT